MNADSTVGPVAATMLPDDDPASKEILVKREDGNPQAADQLLATFRREQDTSLASEGVPLR